LAALGEVMHVVTCATNRIDVTVTAKRNLSNPPNGHDRGRRNKQVGYNRELHWPMI